MKKQALMVAAMAMAFGSTGSLGMGSEIEERAPFISEPVFATGSRAYKHSRTNQRKRRKNIRQVPQLLRAKANRK